MFDDLKEAIRNVLNDATPNEEDEFNNMIVSRKLLSILQAEYNIYFVEPEDKQLNII